MHLFDKIKDKTILLFNLSIFSGSQAELLTLLEAYSATNKSATVPPLIVATPNPEQVVLTRRRPDFSQALLAADIRLPDGIGLVHASKLFSIRYAQQALRQRIAGRSVVQALLQWAADQSLTVMVIGGRALGEGGRSAATPTQRLKPIQTTDGTLLGSDHWYWLEGYQDVAQPTKEEQQTLIRAISKLRPAIIFVAFGAPYQEQWLATHRPLLQESGVRVAMAVGGSLDSLTGQLQLAPQWVEQLGLEWLFRLYQEPQRWRRQLRLPAFIALTLQGLTSRKLAGIE